LTGIREWKKPPEIQAPKITYLSSLNTAQLIMAIQSIGPIFKEYAALSRCIADLGLDGNTLSNMSDTDMKSLLITACELSELHAIILIARLKSWQQQLI
jgi:hypothetical protein